MKDEAQITGDDELKEEAKLIGDDLHLIERNVFVSVFYTTHKQRKMEIFEWRTL